MEHGLQEEQKLPEEMQEQVLRLAVRLQAEDAGRLTPSQLEQVAAEVGIDSQYVRAAMEQLSRTPSASALEQSEFTPPPLKTRLLILSLVALTVSAVLLPAGKHPEWQQLLWASAVLGGLGCSISLGPSAATRWSAFWRSSAVVMSFFATVIFANALYHGFNAGPRGRDLFIMILISGFYGLLSLAAHEGSKRLRK